MKVIGLTGPIGAGKDTVSKILKRRGAYIIDADKAAHQLYSSQSPVWHDLVRAFGSKILARGGKINRKKLGAIVFGDKKRLAQLNKIVHPALKAEILSIADGQKTKAANRLIVINAAVLKEIGLADSVDSVWLVTAPKKIRLKRLIKKGIAKAEAQARIDAQVTQKEYLNMADQVIINDGSLKQLKNKLALQNPV